MWWEFGMENMDLEFVLKAQLQNSYNVQAQSC